MVRFRSRAVVLFFALILALVVAACGEPDASPGQPSRGEPASPSTPPTATPSPGETSEPPAGTSPSPTPTPGVSADPPPLELELVADGLDAPIGIAGAPGGWLLVNERIGRVVAVDAASGERSVVLDLTDRVLGEGERGLLGLALHPEWPSVGRAFVHYSDRNGNTVLSEVASGADPSGMPTFDAASERVLLQVQQPYSNHNGGQLAFGPDGYLYMGLGDGGSGGDPQGNGQDPGVLLGKVLRLDVSEPGAYAIPADNPFAGGGGAAEAFLIGLRNPWRFSFDRATGRLWIADVGQNVYEEVNRLDPTTQGGANLGWNTMEGAHCFATASCSTDGLVMPIAEYTHEIGCSVTGGHVYRGPAIPELAGWYLFSDYCSGLLMGVPSDADPAAGVLAPRILLETGAAVSSFGEGTDGELYMADIGSGRLYRIVAGG